MDFLGLKNLTIIESAIKIIKNTRGVKIDIDKIPLDDKKTYKLFQDGETTGVFQFESSGMKRYLRELKPTEFEDIIAMVALYRPGPMEWIPDYIAGKHGKKNGIPASETAADPGENLRRRDLPGTGHADGERLSWINHGRSGCPA